MDISRNTVDGAWASDDAELLGRARVGDEGACETLVRRHSGRMHAVARRFLRSEEDRADAVQDSFLAAFLFLATFVGNSTLGTWLHRIVVNTCLMKLRTQSRNRPVLLGDLLPAWDGRVPHTRPIGPWEEQALTRLTREE